MTKIADVNEPLYTSSVGGDAHINILKAICLLHSTRVANVGRMQNGKVSSLTIRRTMRSKSYSITSCALASPLNAGNGSSRANYMGVIHGTFRSTRIKAVPVSTLPPTPRSRNTYRNAQRERVGTSPPTEEEDTGQSNWWTLLLRVSYVFSCAFSMCPVSDRYNITWLLTL